MSSVRKLLVAIGLPVFRRLARVGTAAAMLAGVAPTLPAQAAV
jgi:hypothetical protein